MYESVIIVPYRKRHNIDELQYFIDIICPKFLNTMNNICICIVEQHSKDNLFNRGKLINIGCKYFKDKTKNFIIHDIDIEPTIEAIKQFYLHETKDIDVYGIYSDKSCSLGGIIKINSELYFKANGHHNKIWGWGFEDFDFKNRINHCKGKIQFLNYRNNDDTNKYFKNLNSFSSKRKIENFNIKKRFFLYTFSKMSDVNKNTFIYSSGVNNLNYTMISNNSIDTNILKLVVDI